MKTLYLRVDPINPDPKIIRTAASFLQQEEVVAFPTETVYGVGALALSPQAVKKIYLAKARPDLSPLQVHISCFEQLHGLVGSLPGQAEKLIQRFWPGPLSLILPALSHIPIQVRGGTATVGLRMPSHPVARALIDLTGPLAATSANLSGRPSPLNAADVRADLDGRISAVLDAGKTGSGLESTVLNLCDGKYRVIRRGGISIEELEEVLGARIEVLSQTESQHEHYKVKTTVLVAGDEEKLRSILHKTTASGGTVGIVYNDFWTGPLDEVEELPNVRRYYLSLNESSMELYALLREAEKLSLTVLLFAPLPLEVKGITASVVDRIKAAAARTPLTP